MQVLACILCPYVFAVKVAERSISVPSMPHCIDALYAFFWHATCSLMGTPRSRLEGTAMQSTCPINHTSVDANTVRAVALLVVAIVALFLLTGSPLIILALVPDFLVRAAGYPGLSPLARLASGLVRLLELKPRATDSAPKRFAAGIGVAFTVTAGLLALAGLAVPAAVVAAILLACAALEGIVGFCLGCRVYMLLPRALFGHGTARGA